MESSPGLNKRPKKILYISPNGYLGGAERIVFSLVKNHHKTDFIPTILFFSRGEFSEACAKENVDHLILQTRFRMRNPLTFLKAIYEVRQIIKRVKPDVIHSTMAYSHIVISLASFGITIKKIWFQHGPVGMLLDRIASLFSVDVLLFNSSYLKKLHFKTLPRVKVYVKDAIIKLGVESYTNTTKIFENDNLIHFGMAGRIAPLKCYELLIQSLAELQKEHELKPFIVSIAGSAKNADDQKYFIFLKELVLQYGLNMNVHFLGHTPSMEHFYQSLDVFIHTSPTPEPFGLVMAEAMSAGRLVIGPNNGGTKDFLIDGVTGIVLHYSQENYIPVIKNAILPLLAKKSLDKQTLNVLAKNGQIFIHKEHSMAEMTRSIESFY